jgi:hypothetical protein
MIDDERKSELQNALEVLTRHNLYRRGYCDMQAAEIDPGELGVVIDVAAGAILEYQRLDVLFDEALKKAAALKTEVNILEHEIKCANKTIDRIADRKNQVEAENRRLKALLASHKIKYKV